MFSRDIADAIKRYANFPVVGILGPRQSGKTTLAKEMFPDHKFISFDKDTDRSFAEDDPEGFLKAYENDSGIIIDEFQYVPRITSYIKFEVDHKKRSGYFILTGSENFLANQAISESLAGRIGILTLLPLSLAELEKNNILSKDVNSVILAGGYPRIYDQSIAPEDFYPAYTQAYVERDVRQLINVGNLRVFQQFLQLCAGRIGQLLNIESLCNEVSISFQTARHWLSILEASYIIFFLQPHTKSFDKRIIKTPKIYFFDTGLACSLLRISTIDSLTFSPFRGHLFECLIIADLYKQYYNAGIRPPLYFWRDRSHEIDCLVDEEAKLLPIEIKAGQTYSSAFFDSLNYWNMLANADPLNGFVVYGGAQSQVRKQGNLISWQKSAHLITEVHQKIGGQTAQRKKAAV